MRNKDVLLVILFVVLVLGIAFGPGLVDWWRARQAADVDARPEAATVDVTEDAGSRTLSPEAQAEAERLRGMLRLHTACAERFEEFDAESQQVVEAWEARFGELLAAAPDQDFRIVLSQPEGLDEAAVEKARAEERAMCERNLDVMRAELAKADESSR